MGRTYISCTCGGCRTCYMRVYMREYRKHRPLTAEQRSRKSEKAKRWAKDNPERHARNTANERAKHPERHAARMELNKAIRRGEIDRQPCESCGSTDRIHGHHDDYDKPLEVRWLCPKHHAEHHRQLRMS